MINVTYNNIVECEQAGMAGLIAYSPQTGETESISSEKMRIFQICPDSTLTDSSGHPMVIAMGSPSVLVTDIEVDSITSRLVELYAIHEAMEIVEDYLAFDRLERRGYFNARIS